MIRFCTCTGGSSSSPVNFKHREGSKTCKNCGGKLSSDGHVVLSGSMLSTVRLEHSRVIDPHLNWKTASKGRQRAVRRARTSFTRINRNSTSKTLKENEDLTDKDSKRTGGMAVSESEKLGVSILGRRFSDNLGSIPIKKRRFLVVRSPSPPPQSSSHSDDSVQIREIESASHEEAASNAKQHAFNINSGVGIKSGQEIYLVREKTNLEDLNEKLCDSVDFSGISILAAAACDSNIGGDVMNVEGSVSEEAKLEEKEEQIHLKEALDGKTNIPPEASKMFQLAGDKSYGTRVDGSCNLDTSMSSLQNVPNKVESSSRDVRLHWDLNTVMDVWDNHSDEVLNSEPLAANIIDEVHDNKPANVESHQDQMGLVDTKCASQFVNSRDFGCLLENNFGLKETKLRVEPVVSGDSSVAGHNEGKECLAIPCGDDLVEEEHELEGASIAIVDASEETKPLHDEKKSSFSAGGFFSRVRDDLVPTRDSSLATAVAEEEKADAHPVGFGLLAESEVSHSLLVPYENSSFSHIPHTCRPHAVMDQIAEVLCEKKTVIASAADLDDFSIQYRPTDVHTRQSAHLRSSEAEKHVSLCNDLGSDNTDRYSMASHLSEEASGEMVDGDICKDIMKTAGVAGERAHSNALDKTECFSADKFREANMITFPSDSHAFNSQMSSNHHERSSGGACVGECEAEVAEMKMPNNKSFVLIDETSETTKAVSPSHSDFAVPICNSEQLNPGMVVHPLDGALNSHGACKGYGDGYATSNGQVALEDHSDCDYYSDTSQMDTDQPTGMEKVEFLGDEDYQYEDGEFRESFVNSWGEDVAEEGETEYVDYGSDNRELDIFEAASDVPPGVPEQVGGVGKTAGLLDGNEDMKYGAEVAKEMQHFSQTLLTCSSEAGFAKRRMGDESKRLEADAKDASDSGEVSDKVTGQREFLNEGNASRKSSHLATLKSSGWDQLPEGCRGSGSVVFDSGAVCESDGRNHADPSNAAGSLRRMVGSYRRGLPSRVENQKTSNVSHRKDKFYVRESRVNGHNDLDSRVERDTGAPRSIGRGGSSLHMRRRGSHNHWVDSSDYRSTDNHDSRGCYGPDSFTNPASKNAAAAAVAKLESNGFVVAADGTILKAGSVRSASRVPGRSAKVSSLSAHRSLVGRRSSTERDGTFGRPLGMGNSKETSPDRHINVDHSRASAGRCGPGMVTTGDRERHHHSMPDDIRDAPLPLHHQLSRTEQSFSPHRRPLHRSRTRSGSRSPQMCTSHRGRNDGGMKSGPGLCLRGRSPNLSEVRTRRLRSPHRRSGLMEHMVGYAPSSRNYSSPPRASKWVDERKDLPYRFRQHEPNRFSGRSPPRRVFSRNHRLDPMDSPGRANLNECYRSKHSGTFPEFVDFDRGYDGPGDDRKVHSNRYEMLQSARQYDTGGNMKRFGYVTEDGFRVHNPRSRSSEFQQMGSPRAFENQLGGSPRRVKRRES